MATLLSTLWGLFQTQIVPARTLGIKASSQVVDAGFDLYFMTMLIAEWMNTVEV